MNAELLALLRALPWPEREARVATLGSEEATRFCWDWRMPMSNVETDAKKAVADAGAAVTAERRRLGTRALQWLKGHPRTLLAIIAALTLLAVTLGLARG
jgi:hypothetical protein